MVAIPNPDNDFVSILKLGGVFSVGFSVVASLLILFVFKTACSFVGSIQLFIMFLLFIAGIIAYFGGRFLSRRQNRA